MEIALPKAQLLNPQKLVVPLSNSEYKLLRAFLASKQILTRDQLLELAIRKSSNSVDRSIDLMVSRLRQKLNDDPRQPSLLETVRGEGYVFSASL
jgi:two-component system OmpR family response regulator